MPKVAEKGLQELKCEKSLHEERHAEFAVIVPIFPL
jgi:hypothetical protein